MRWFVGISLWVLALCVCITPAVSLWQSRDSNYNVKIVSGGFTPSCSQSSTFLAAASGVTLTADKTNYDTLICSLVSDGVWNFDVLYIWAAPDLATSKINLANPGTFNATTNGTVNFTAYQGFTGDGSTFYIDSGFNPSTASSPKFVQNSASVGVYVLNTRTTSNMWDVGCSVGACANGVLFSPILASGNVDGLINSTTDVGGGSPGNSQGAWILTRTTSSFEGVWKNSAAGISSTPDTSVTPPNVNIYFFAFNSGFGFSSDQIAAGWIGQGVGDNNAAVAGCKINNRINTYMTNLSVPKNVYTNSAC